VSSPTTGSLRRRIDEAWEESVFSWCGYAVAKEQVGIRRKKK
jgi:hypothetical protein